MYTFFYLDFVIDEKKKRYGARLPFVPGKQNIRKNFWTIHRRKLYDGEALCSQLMKLN